MSRTLDEPAPSTSPRPLTNSRLVTQLAALTIAGIVLYVVLDVIAQLLPPHYSPLRQAESDLAVGPYGWVMTVNFVVRGLLSLALLLALIQILPDSPRKRLGVALFGTWTIGAFLLALFPTDVTSGEHTAHGKLHLLIALLAFISIPIAELLLSQCLSTVPRWQALGQQAIKFAWLTVFGLVLLVVMAPITRVSGLGERIFLATALLWMLAVSVQLIRLQLLQN